MANIYKRGSKWSYRVYVGKDPVTGKDKQKTKSGFIKKKDAQLAAAIVERQFHGGQYVAPSKINLKTVSEAWLDAYSVDAKESTVKMRRQAIKKLIDNFDDKILQQVTKENYQKFINDLSKIYSRNHVKIIHTSSRMLFQYAQEEMKLINHSPCDGVKLPKERQTVEDIENEDMSYNYMEKAELEEFLTVAKNNGMLNDFALFTTIAYTGLRVGELRALQWKDINFKEKSIKVRKTLHNIKNNRKKFDITTPKTQKSIRTISIDPFVVELLKQHKNEQVQIKKENHILYNDFNFIFASNEGYPLTVTLINDRMKRLLGQTSIEKELSSHSFRHTHTSLLIEAGVHIKEIQERLGHASLSTTMDIYASMTKTMKQDASNKFSQLMGSVSEKLNSTET
ncbi:site-specific integrase [Corticicoccus populi]|uniref:Tyrosine-type recombinase/integrase n=1 Tax=Corticicoccus populi TaxID=1812821 RepID=A0ABW5WV10_9STAP